MLSARQPWHCVVGHERGLKLRSRGCGSRTGAHDERMQHGTSCRGSNATHSAFGGMVMQCLARVRRQVQEACTASELKERGVSQRLDGFARDLQRSKDRTAILASREVPRRATDECARGVFLGAEARLVSSPTKPRTDWYRVACTALRGTVKRNLNSAVE